jgi:hypothetical protein
MAFSNSIGYNVDRQIKATAENGARQTMQHFNRTHHSLIVLWLVSALQSSPLVAAEQKFLELQEQYVQWREDYTVNDDYTVESTQHFQLQALTDNAARDMNKHRVSWSTSIEKVDIIEAYTLKSDGRKIDVPKDNYQVTINRGNKDGGPVFSDRTRMTIVYPELESGDSIVLTLHRTESEPMFPGEFSIADYFYDQTAYDDARVSISMPTEMKPHIQIRGMQQEVKDEGDRTLIELSYSNPKPLKSEREDYSAWEWESQNGFAISSFDSYQDIANAYGARALPKALPTARVRELAAEIVGQEKDLKKAAKLLYDWVATNISYAGNCIGVGAVVPHDTDFILDNRMGDCKDHATLLQALYTSTGIESVQALINSGSSYSLPSIPMVSSVNHVINYIPEFDQFVDSTNPDMPFDSLGFSVADKPVLLVEDYKEGKRTPASEWQTDWQKAESTIAINPDGSASGKITVALAGQPAIQARAIWRQLTQQQEEDWLNDQFSGSGKKGSAAIERDDPKPLHSAYKYSIEFKAPELIPSQGAGGMYLGTPGFTPLPVFSFVGVDMDTAVDYQMACSNGYSTEKLSYSFPDNVKILAVPDDYTLEENHLSYKASYALTDNTLVVERELQDKTPGNVCSPELMNAQQGSLKKISKNLISQVVFQYM